MVGDTPKSDIITEEEIFMQIHFIQMFIILSYIKKAK